MERAAGPTRASAAGVGAHDVDVLLEVGDAQRAREARRAARRQHVVGAGHVVADHGGRVRADEHRARVAHERHEQVGVDAHELEVLGRDRVRGVDGAAPRRRR